jgi:hypothetical protein
MNVEDDTLMDDDTFVQSIRRNITDSISTALGQQAIRQIQNTRIDIWTERPPIG